MERPQEYIINASRIITFHLEEKMKRTIQKLFTSVGKFKQSHYQLLMALVILSLLVLGAGAPGTTGGVGGH